MVEEALILYKDKLSKIYSEEGIALLEEISSFWPTVSQLAEDVGSFTRIIEQASIRAWGEKLNRDQLPNLSKAYDIYYGKTSALNLMVYYK